MNYVLTDTNGKTVVFENAVSVVLDRDKEAVADALTLVLACDVCNRDFAFVCVEHDGKVIFKGIVDEQTETQTAAAVLVEIVARSMAAVLLDNEALPQIYHKPSMDEIFRRHIQPLGFESYIGKNGILNGELSITKGLSVWRVLQMFQSSCGGAEPKVRMDGTIDVSDNREEQTVILSPKIMVERSHTKKRYSVISKVCTRGRSGAGYEIAEENPLAKKLNICRIRYLNAANTVSRSVNSGASLIAQGNRAYEYTKMRCVGCLLYPLGTKIIAEGQKDGILTALTYRKTMNGETTDLTVAHENGEE